MLKTYIIQRSILEPIPCERLHRVDYDELLKTMRFPLMWVYEHYLQAWLPREVDERLILSMTGYRLDNDRLMRRLTVLGLLEVPQLRWEDLKDQLKADGYVKVPGIVPAGYCAQLADYFYRQPEVHERWPDMPGIKRTSVNDSPLMRLVHEATLKLALYVLDADIKTSYSFTAAYEAGTVLPRHTDRPQCVYNASVILGVDPSSADPKEWPLFIEVNGVPHAAKLNVGDAVFYAGTRDPHWRNELPANMHRLLGTFFHYVPADFAGSLA
jgi:hypothetical protein